MPENLPEEDRPSAGTPCLPCKKMGHFCQATGYDDDSLPKCYWCLNGWQCSAIAAKNGVCLKDWETNPSKRTRPIVDEDPFQVPSISKEERANNRHDLIADLLKEGMTVAQIKEDLSMPEHVIVDVRKSLPDLPRRIPQPRPEITVKTDVILESSIQQTTLARPMVKRDPSGRGRVPNLIRAAILEEPLTVPNNKLEAKYGVSVAWIGKFRREHGIITPGMNGIVENRGRRQGMDYKEPAKQKAAEMLKDGKSLREVSREVGLAKNTVNSIRKEIVEDLPEHCACGELLGHRGWCKVRFEKSETRQEVVKRMHQSRGVATGPAKDSSFRKALDEAEGEIEWIENELMRLADRHTKLVELSKTLKAMLE